MLILELVGLRFQVLVYFRVRSQILLVRLSQKGQVFLSGKRERTPPSLQHGTSFPKLVVTHFLQCDLS